MVEDVRRGHSQRAVAIKYRVSLSVVQYWLSRASGRRLERVDWKDRPCGPHRPPNKVSPRLEQNILLLRRKLREESDLGEYGAAAIQRELLVQNGAAPSIRTIGRVLSRCGALDAKHRQRFPHPPTGWYLPARGQLEVDSFDIIEGLRFQGGQRVEVLTGTSLFGGLVAAWPRDVITTEQAIQSLLERWRQHGLPAYAQFDNDTIFQGGHNHPDTIGRITRMCLSLQVTPVFTPVKEVGFQAAIENFNGRWQRQVWRRFVFSGFPQLCQQSNKFIAACLERNAPRRDNAPPRIPFPPNYNFDPQTHPNGTIIYLRRTDDQGRISLLGHQFMAADHWQGRPVRADVNLDQDVIQIYALRRKEPQAKTLLNEVKYHWPRKQFQG